MSTIYKYYKDDIELTFQQAQVQNGRYQKYEFINGSLKFIYFLNEGEIVWGSYFLEEGEIVTQELLQEYCIDNQWGFAFYTSINSSGQYTLWQGAYYSPEGVLGNKSQIVLDQEGFSIARVQLDFDTEVIKHGFKRYYGINPENGKKEVFIQFNYKRDTFELSVFLDNYYGWDVDESGAGTEDHFYLPEVIEDFVYDDYPYYHNLLPLLPESDIV